MKLRCTEVIFDHEFEIYTDGQTKDYWFRATNVAKILHYSVGSVNRMMSHVDDCDKQICDLTICSGTYLKTRARKTQRVWFINEYGLYDILLRSSRPNARVISRKIREFLIVLRQGGYVRNITTFQDAMEEYEERIAKEEYGWAEREDGTIDISDFPGGCR